MPNLIERVNHDMDRVIQGVWRSLVQIRNGVGAGAGTVWHSDGLIVTNAHVLGARGLSVILSDGRALPARVLAADRGQDVAALAVEATGLPTITLGDSRRLRPGQWVTAVGHPWGVTGAATAGIVTGSGVALPEAPRLGREWIATDLHLRPGHSGGPLVDSEGRLVGINTIMAGPNVGLAVPVHVIVRFLRQTLGSRADTGIGARAA
jgi:serine protease Do